MNNLHSFSPQTTVATLSWVTDRIQQKKPFSIRGNSSRAPQPFGDTLSTKSINKVLFFDPDDMVIGVQAGLEVGNLQKILGEQNMFLPINPWYPKSTIGGVVACNDYGPDRMNSGGLRDYLIGVEYINGKGELVKAGGKVVKNVTGYDLGKMMLGSLGGLGIITSINFKVTPCPVNPQTCYCHFETSNWLDLVKIIHEKMIPLDWIEAIYFKSGWILGLGFSGNEKRTARIERDLRSVVTGKAKWEVYKEGFSPKTGECYPGHNRATGFLETLLDPLPLNGRYLHLHCMIPTGNMLTRMRWQELEEMGAYMILHPVGSDCHVIINKEDLKTQIKVVELLKTLLGPVSGKMMIIQSHRDLSTDYLGQSALPSGYSLMKRLKEQLDPSAIFISPFYQL